MDNTKLYSHPYEQDEIDTGVITQKRKYPQEISNQLEIREQTNGFHNEKEDKTKQCQIKLHNKV